MTFKVWNKKTNKILDTSTICTALDPKTHNLRANPLADNGLVHHNSVQWLHGMATGEQSDAETGERTSTVADYGERITGRPPDGDTAVPDVPADTATVVPTINDDVTSGERTSTDADWGGGGGGSRASLLLHRSLKPSTKMKTSRIVILPLLPTTIMTRRTHRSG